MGEGFGVYPLGRDAELLAFVTSANVACGFHAGDPTVMDRTVALAVEAGVAVGAHPGFPDLRGFGRRRVDADPADVERDVLYQVGALQAFARAHGARDGVVVAVDGREVRLRADTLCLHGDNPEAVANARAVRQALERAGVEVRGLAL